MDQGSTTRRCGRANPFGSAHPPERLSPDPLLAVGCGTWCRGSCPASRGQAGGRAMLAGRPVGKWKRSFCGHKGSAPLVKARRSCLLSAQRAGPASRCGQGNGRRRRRQRLHPTRAMGVWGKVLARLRWKTPALPRAAGHTQECWDTCCTPGWLCGGLGCRRRLGGRQLPSAGTGPLAKR